MFDFRNNRAQRSPHKNKHFNFFHPKNYLKIMIKNFEKLQFLFYSSSFIMELEPKRRNFFGSGSSQKADSETLGIPVTK